MWLTELWGTAWAPLNIREHVCKSGVFYAHMVSLVGFDYMTCSVHRLRVLVRSLVRAESSRTLTYTAAFTRYQPFADARIIRSPRRLPRTG